MMHDDNVLDWLKTRGIAMLVDPDVGDVSRWKELSFKAKENGVKLILVGGSFLHKDQLSECINSCKYSGLPVWIFPGFGDQISNQADGFLLLSLLSGRNPDLLIGQHVLKARTLRDAGIPILPTAYLLMDGGNPTTASYISNTMPIPANKPQLAAATALAGQQLGMQLIYLDAGSGAMNPVNADVINAVSSETILPLFVGGGIRSVDQVKEAWNAGADWVVIGSAIEENADFLFQLKELNLEI